MRKVHLEALGCKQNKKSKAFHVSDNIELVTCQNCKERIRKLKMLGYDVDKELSLALKASRNSARRQESKKVKRVEIPQGVILSELVASWKWGSK